VKTFAYIAKNIRFLGFGLACTLASNLGQTYFIALFGDLIRADLNLTNSGFGAVYGAATLVSGVMILWAGRWIDRTDLRVYATVVLAGLALSSALMAWALGPWVLAAAFVGLRLFGQGLLRHTAFVSMARYFEASRGRAMSIVGLGYPIAEALFPTLLVLLLGVVSWREAWTGFALYLFFVHIPLALWLLKGHGQRHAHLQQRLDNDARPDPKLTQRQLLCDWRYLTVLPAVFMGPFIMTGLFFHQLPIASQKGWDIALLAASFPAFAGASVASGLTAGWVVDRHGAGWGLTVFVWPLTLALIVLATFDQAWTVALYLALSGLTFGAGIVLTSATWAETYGVRQLGTIRSLTTALVVMSTAVAPVLVGWLLDAGVQVAAIAWGGALITSAAGLTVLAPARALRRKRPSFLQ